MDRIFKDLFPKENQIVSFRDALVTILDTKSLLGPWAVLKIDWEIDSDAEKELENNDRTSLVRVPKCIEF